MKKNNEGFIPVIIILVVLIGFVGVYYLGRLNPKKEVSNSSPSPITTVTGSSKPAVPTAKPTTDPTANWKAFDNKLLGVYFKYPLDMESSNRDNFVSIFRPQTDVLIFELNKIANSDIETQYLKDKENMQSVTPLKNMKVNNYDAMESFVTDIQLDGRKLYIQNKEDLFTILVSNCPDCTAKEIGTQILSTFKFTN